MPLEDQISPEPRCSWPQEAASLNRPYLESTRVPHCCDRNNESKKRWKTRTGKTQNKDIWLLKIIRWKLFFFLSKFALTSWKSCQLTVMSAHTFEVGLKKAVFSLHCVQKLIYRSWPWLLFCATAILENNGRKAWNLRGTESAVFHFFSSYSTENFPSLSKIALFLCPTGAINWCLSIPWPGNRAEFNWTHGDSCFVPHGARGAWQRKPRPPGDPAVTHWPPHGGIKA